MKYNVCVFTSTRADYGLLRNIISKINKSDFANLILLATGTHFSNKFGKTISEIKNDNYKYIRVNIPVNNSNNLRMSLNMAKAQMKFTKLLSKLKLGCIIILGDRYEALSAAISSYILRIPIIHISGGDVTKGALDDGFRHSITKLSSLHFPGSLESYNRIIRMGEQPNNVFYIGDPGIENCLNIPLHSRLELSKLYSNDIFLKKYSIVTFHPTTLSNFKGIESLKELIKAMDSIENMSYIITLSNADSGGEEMNVYWKKQALLHKNWFVTPSLGSKNYLSSLKYACFVLGNSSSGVVEAPIFNVPTVNIGSRQEGRNNFKSIFNCEANCDAIKKSIFASLEYNKNKSSSYSSIDADFSDKFIEILQDYLTNNKLKIRKSFYDGDKK